jgi:DNA-binding NarL/FixJ family response regulator
MTSAESPTLFLVDDHDVVRAGTRSLLADRFRIVGEADNAIDAIELIRERSPDLVLLDVRLPGGGGVSVVRAVKATHPGVGFMVYTASTSKKDFVALMRLGVAGYVTKGDHDTRLVQAVLDALEGLRPTSREVAAHVLDIDDAITTDSTLERLTPREREVTNLIARGLNYAEIARRLVIAPKTVESHVNNIYGKLEVANRHELAALFYEEGFFRPEDNDEAVD